MDSVRQMQAAVKAAQSMQTPQTSRKSPGGGFGEVMAADKQAAIREALRAMSRSTEPQPANQVARATAQTRLAAPVNRHDSVERVMIPDISKEMLRAQPASRQDSNPPGRRKIDIWV